MAILESCMLGNPHVQFGGRESEKYRSQWQLVGFLSYITYIRLPSCFVYLACLLDAYSRRCVGWQLSKRIDTELALGALDMALTTRSILPGLIHHSSGASCM
jgi:transposase InsO family protein